MSPIETIAILITAVATVYGLALCIFWPIGWVVRRCAAEREYQRFLREHSVFNKGGRDRVS